MKSPAFQFYAAEFLVDENVVLMTNQEVGCYIKLMAYCWREGSVPADVSKIAKLCGEESSAMAQLWPAISSCFAESIADENRLVHPRLEKERDKQEEHRKERAESGKKGAEKRWGAKHAQNDDKSHDLANGSAIKEPMAENGSSSSSATSSSKGNKYTRTPKADAFGVLQILETFPTLDESVANDFLKHRKAKRAPLTQSAWDAISREIMASGWTPDAALRETMARGWQSFKADWVAEKPQRFGSKTAPEDISNWVPASMRGTPDDPLFDGDYIDAIQ